MRIICIKWGDKYTDEYVLNLKAACEKYIPHDKFWCMTDQPHSLLKKGVFTVPMNTDLPGWWSKIGLFRPNYFSGDNLYLDLDVVITGGIEPLIAQYAQQPSKLWAIDDFSYSLVNPRQGLSDDFKATLGGIGTINSSVMLFRGAGSGEARHVWQRAVEANFEFGQLHGDQNFITKCLWPDHIRLLDSRGLVGSYKYHGGEPYPITVFHGDPKPHQLKGWVSDAWAA